MTPTGSWVGTTRLRSCLDRVSKSQDKPSVEITVALLMNWIIAELPLELSLCRRSRSWSPTSLLCDTEPLHMRADARSGMLAADSRPKRRGRCLGRWSPPAAPTMLICWPGRGTGRETSTGAGDGTSQWALPRRSWRVYSPPCAYLRPILETGQDKPTLLNGRYARDPAAEVAGGKVPGADYGAIGGAR